MDTGGSPIVTVRKNALTPKAVIYQRFGNKACYTLEEVQETAQNGCPGLAIAQKGPCLYRCFLQLPEVSVVSGIFKKKKEAEQSAAELALEKLGIDPTANCHTVEDPWEALVGRVKYLFSDEFLTSLHPLSGHFRAALQREGDQSGCTPVSVVAILDAKLSTISKLIDSRVELKPYLVISYIIKAASWLPGILATSEEQLWIKRHNQYSMDLAAEELTSSPRSIEAVFIPCSYEKSINVVNLDLSTGKYYLDVIAEQLGLGNASKLLITRPIGKASSEARLYFAASKSYIANDMKNSHSERDLNTRASYLGGEDIYGDAIFASVGYTWKSKDLFYEGLNRQSYYRMVLNKVPSGIYKLSLGAILMADLPLAFTTRTNWRGALPRDVLCIFCRQHRLLEPTFSSVSISESLSELSGSHKKLKVTDSAAVDPHYGNGSVAMDSAIEATEMGGMFGCEVKVYSKFHELVIECTPKQSFKKQSDAIQNASLQVLLWLDTYFKDLDVPVDKLESSASDLDIKFYPQNYSKAFELCRPIHYFKRNGTQEERFYDSEEAISGQFSLDISGPDSGISPLNGSLACISYTVSLVNNSETVQELLESHEKFEFEIGTGSIISQFEAAVMQMTIGQSAFLCAYLPPPEFILAAGEDSGRILPLLSEDCCLKYTMTLLQITEPMEERMEQALFSPPLSKQRVEYALQHIKQSCATNLVDFGCGSGSLLDSLLSYQTSLEKIVGVDISHKSLVRAAKILHSKLNSNKGIKSASLYDGSITEFDPRLHGFDIGTCLEVIEHMEEDQAWLFGDVVLCYFCPKILIVSTPNYEYNVILQKSISSQEEDPDDKTQSQSCKFRNHDHKFEWTREQFNHWAMSLAVKHNYSVEFSGVGGRGDVEPGFASQIAVFRIGTSHSGPIDVDIPKMDDSEHEYSVVWEWNGSD